MSGSNIIRNLLKRNEELEKKYDDEREQRQQLSIVVEEYATALDLMPGIGKRVEAANASKVIEYATAKEIAKMYGVDLRHAGAFGKQMTDAYVADHETDPPTNIKGDGLYPSYMWHLAKVYL